VFGRLWQRWTSRAAVSVPCTLYAERSIFVTLRPPPSFETLNLLLMVRHYLVKGRVQGVGFRWFVHREAAALELHGWVRNTEDGHVEVLASGDAESLADLAAALRRGSRGSRVDAVVEHDLDDKEAESLGPFQIEGAW
jgi:acylphosphatase